MSDNSVLFWQNKLLLPSFSRGFHLIQRNIEESLQDSPKIKMGLLHIFIQHTSASLCLSEHTCRSVRKDLEHWYNKNIPDNSSEYEHNLEGADDMPAHIKNTLLGSSLTLPLTNGQLSLGRWQGVMLCEHRNQAEGRSLILTAQGQSL